MSTVNTKALHAISFADDGKQVSKLPTDAPFKLSTAIFDELVVLGAVRKATKEDAGGEDDAEEVAPTETQLEVRERGAKAKPASDDLLTA